MPHNNNNNKTSQKKFWLVKLYTAKERWMEISNNYSIYHWWLSMIASKTSQKNTKNMLNCMLSNEKPDMCSVIFERSCNNNCLHCIYCKEEPSRHYSTKYNLQAATLNIVKKLPTIENSVRKKPPALIHAGRIFLPWHLDTLIKTRKMRPDMEIGIINSGQIANHLNEIVDANFFFDWYDTSIDGPPKENNLQRNSPGAFAEALLGIRKVGKILTNDATINAGYTITKINFAVITKTADIIFDDCLADRFIIAPITPERSEIKNLEASEDDFLVVWKQLKKVFQKHNVKKKKVFFQIFRHQDIWKIALAVGLKKFYQAISEFSVDGSNGITKMEVGKIEILIDGVTIQYFPMSICCTEGVMIDSDAFCRTPLSQPHTIKSLRENPYLNNFNILQLNHRTNLDLLHINSVLTWFWSHGHSYFIEELQTINKIRGDG